MKNRNLEITIPRSCPVVLLMFLMACSQVGTIKTIGIYLEDISWSLGTTSADIGLALGLFNAFGTFLAPLIVALYRLRTIRRVMLISGSCFISLGVVLTAMATTNAQIAIYLAISGIGHCILGTLTTVALDQIAKTQNFDSLYALGMSGFGLGMVLLPFLADVLGLVYGWRGGLLILCGLMCNLIPCATAIQVEPSSCNDKVSDVIDDFNGSGSDEERDCKDYSTDGEITPLCPESGRGAQPDRTKRLVVGEVRSAKSSAVDHNQMDPHEHDSSSRPCLGRLSERVRGSDFYRSRVFNLVLLANMTFGVVYCGLHGFLVPHAIQRGYSINAAILMTFFASIGNFLGRLLTGALSDRLAKPIILYLVATLLNIVAILCDVILRNNYVMFVMACLSAISIASKAVLGPLILRKTASPGSFNVAYAAHELLFGFGNFLGGYLSGMIGGLYSSYDAAFVFLGCTDIVVLLLMLSTIKFIHQKPK
ncbi:monocarboxylate transporter 5-like [Lytechinus pictus]|uniref:monocarboxylate transporter 5-like n=1 Tax=Lytechinus pictus TaxID=7653 RepID=UPI0030B9C3EB